jgi:predicted NodU family carbamoyl transferase
MMNLGVSGFFNSTSDRRYDSVSPHFYHDAAAALVVDRTIVAAAEQERFDRIKHSNNFPLEAIASCLRLAGAELKDIDLVAFFFEERHTDRDLLALHLRYPEVDFRGCRQLVVQLLERHFETRLHDSQLVFARHHEAHAASAFFDRPEVGAALICVVDGAGEQESISLFEGNNHGLELLRDYGPGLSLGHYYGFMTDYLGFGDFSEYKVMGLAAYGDPSRFRAVVRGGYDLCSDGLFALSPDEIARRLALAGVGPRNPLGKVTVEHMDAAAAIQEAVNEILIHILGYIRRETGLTSLCVAGGVGQNSSANGSIAASGLFDKMFVHYAPHDAGAALGAALLTSEPSKAKHASAESADRSNERLGGIRRGVPFLGPPLEGPEYCRNLFERWASVIEYEEITDPSEQVALPLAQGKLVGVARGRAEFGPRALGHRSILADPRESETRTRVNDLVKRREQFRPLAPVVLREAASAFFLLPECSTALEYMGVVVGVRPDAQECLRAVTHVDGTARVQLVDRAFDPWLYHLIEAFGKMSGVPVLLNTSFNNHAEPMVQSADDALQCFLTCALDLLVLDDYLVTRLGAFSQLEIDLHVAVQAGAAVVTRNYPGDDSAAKSYHLEVPGRRRTAISGALAERMAAAQGGNGFDVKAEDHLYPEIASLWEERLLAVRPVE